MKYSCLAFVMAVGLLVSGVMGQSRNVAPAESVAEPEVGRPVEKSADLTALAGWFTRPNAELSFDWRYSRLEVSAEAVDRARVHVRKIADAAGLAVADGQLFIPYLREEPSSELLRETLFVAWPFWRRVVQFNHSEVGSCTYIDVRDELGTDRTHFVGGALAYEGRGEAGSPAEAATGVTFELWRLRELFSLINQAADSIGWEGSSADGLRFHAPWAAVEPLAGELESLALFPPGFGRYTGFLACQLSIPGGVLRAVRLDWYDPLGVVLATDEVGLSAAGTPDMIRQTVWLPGGGPAIYVSERQGNARYVGEIAVGDLAWEPIDGELNGFVDVGLSGRGALAVRAGAEAEADVRRERADFKPSPAGGPEEAEPKPVAVVLSGGWTQQVPLTASQLAQPVVRLLVDPDFAPDAQLVGLKATCECGKIERLSAADDGPWLIEVHRADSGSIDSYASFDLILNIAEDKPFRVRLDLGPEAGVMPGAFVPMYIGSSVGPEPVWDVAIPISTDIALGAEVGAELYVEGDLRGILEVREANADGGRELAGRLSVADAGLWGALEGSVNLPLDGGGAIPALLYAESHPFGTSPGASFRVARPVDGRLVRSRWSIELDDSLFSSNPGGAIEMSSWRGMPAGRVELEITERRLDVRVDWSIAPGADCEALQVVEVDVAAQTLRFVIIDPYCLRLRR
ncbi:hypothetical protein Pla86_42870 [Planctomycetes bacterium Pla86]|uniref:Uncharacterized protein n=2 Tax=Engelhardtia mirabilis TaxID=2528011 RepID=A0A518BQD3_9BACT|nr:hypothetical protein Pla133_42880 [Planctomycetes bacterium Pla133]QDV03498.1 hypothetical protein Pla86_42870 [Planctomycetes bacterium Pla86]